MADEAEIDVVIRAKKEGTEAFLAVKEELRSIKESLRELQRQAEQTNTSLAEVAASSLVAATALQALNAATGNSTNSLNSNTSATQGAAQASTAASGILAKLGGNFYVVAGLVAGATMVLIAIAPILLAFAGYVYITTVYLIGAVTVLLTFTAGLLAMAGVLALALGAFGLLGVAVVLLGERFAQTGKIMNDPLLGLEKNLGRMADAWGRQALPMSREIIAWLDSLIPRISRAGQELLRWFGEQLPAVLKFATGVIDAFSDAWDKLRPVLQPILEMVVQHAPEWLTFFRTILDIGVGAINALLGAFVRLSTWFGERLPTMIPIVQHVMSRLGDAFDGFSTNLGKLSDWFIDRLPQMEVIANEALGGMGQVIQKIGKVAGDLVDWFIKNWPEIRKQAQDAFKALKDGWDTVAPLLQTTLPLALLIVADAIDTMTNHSQLAHDVLIVLGAGIALLAAIAIGAVVLIAFFIKALGLIDQAAHWAWQKISDLVDIIGQLKNMVANPISILILIAAKVSGQSPNQGGGGGGGGFVPGAGAGGGGGANISFDTGGIVPGPVGAPMLAIVHGGETVIPFGEKGGAGNKYVVTFNIHGVSDPMAVAAEVDRRMAYLLTLT